MLKSDAFDGKHVLVIGGTSGIGLAIGQAFLMHAAAVAVTGLTEEEIKTAQKSGLTAQQLDVTDDAAVVRVLGGLPRLDILINCAGTIRRGDEHAVKVFEHVVDVNLIGTMRCCTAARQLLAKSQGCVINTASMLSFFGGGLVPGYSASKGGIAQLTKSLAISYAAEGIRVNAIAPGWIATQLTKALQDDASRAGPILARTPLGRWGTPEDVAGAALFLASPWAAFITGIVLPVDGGYLIA